MPVTADAMLNWCRKLLGDDPEASGLSLEDYLKAIPRLDQLADLPPGSRVLVRGDVDAKPGEKIGQGDVRLRSMVETLNYGRQRGWKQVIFGHIGRKPEGSLEKVAKRIGQLLETEAPLVENWLDESSMTIPAHVAEKIASLPQGGVLVLQNARAYSVERALWKAKPDDLGELAPRLAALANEMAEKVAANYVHEALSAGSMDASSTVVPAAMDRVALGKYIAAELEGPMLRCRRAQMVVFSGLKIDKLDDLEAMIARGAITRVFSAGSLAMALKKAAAQLDNSDFQLGVAEDPAHADKPYYIPPQRIEQAKKMVAEGRRKGVEFVLPVDFVLQDQRVSETIGPQDQQFDVGPKTRELFARKVDQFLQAPPSSPDGARVVFHNGVFGMFEDERFEAGTRDFVGQLKRMTDAGVEVYVGGGEGGKALEKYGKPDWVTHCFTAGGTVLNALGDQPIPYLAALRMAAAK